MFHRSLISILCLSGSAALLCAKEPLVTDPLKTQPLVVLYRMDRNRDGVLQYDEIPETAREHASELVTRAGYRPDSKAVVLRELANRYQRDNLFWTNRMAPSFVTGTAPPAATSPGRSPQAIANHFAAQYDSNANGVLERDEWRAMGRRWAGADANDDGQLSEGEVARHLGRIDVEEKTGGPAPRASYKLRPTYDGDLPAWFREKDHDHDGQVMMFEFVREGSAAEVRFFGRFDLNNDGIIERSECHRVNDVTPSAATTAGPR